MGSDDNRETREQIIKLFQCQVEKNAQCQIVPIWSDWRLFRFYLKEDQ